MPNFAVIENELVINVILADTKDIAEEITGLTCIEFNLENNPAYIGGKYQNGIFSHPDA